jgi:aspartate/methionine/tyrosine aminotransferase
MTGWRLGWLLVPDRLRRAVDRLTGNFTICPPALAQHAAVAAFTPEGYAEADGHVARYAANRAVLLDGLTRLGIDRLAPADGAFYVYADVSHLTDDSMAWTYRLLAQTGVALAPGIDFDPTDGHRWVRFSFAGAADDIKGALDRLERWPDACPEDQRRSGARRGSSGGMTSLR